MAKTQSRFICQNCGAEYRKWTGRCDGCGLASDLENSGATAVYYAYFVGYGGHDAGLPDCNVGGPPNLCSDGAGWIKQNRGRLLSWYEEYARLTYQASPNKGVVWLLEGDFIQYTYEEQNDPLSISELSELTTDIVCAIKTNEPNAAVAINHSAWIREPRMGDYFDAMPMDLIDMVWTTGMGNLEQGYLNESDSYGCTDCTYAYLSERAGGKKILADTSFGASQASDSWTGIGAEILNQRIADGVIAANVTSPPGDYQSRIDGLASQLSSTCQ